jgi:hypothetical protein
VDATVFTHSGCLGHCDTGVLRARIWIIAVRIVRLVSTFCRTDKVEGDFRADLLAKIVGAGERILIADVGSVKIADTTISWVAVVVCTLVLILADKGSAWVTDIIFSAYFIPITDSVINAILIGHTPDLTISTAVIAIVIIAVVALLFDTASRRTLRTAVFRCRIAVRL